MQTLITALHILTAISLILVVLLQTGRSGGMGGGLGNAGGQIFGGRGAGNFLSKITTIAAIIFFLTSLTLSMLSSRERSLVLKAQQAATPPAAAPAIPQHAPEETPPAPETPPAAPPSTPETPPTTPP